MKTLFLIPVLFLTACGGAAPITETITKTVTAGGLTCPTDMNLLPATTGYVETCIDKVVQGPSGINFAFDSCALAGRSVCSSPELFHARESVGITDGWIWAQESANGQNMMWQGEAAVGLSTMPGQAYFYCCMR